MWRSIMAAASDSYSEPVVSRDYTWTPYLASDNAIGTSKGFRCYGDTADDGSLDRIEHYDTSLGAITTFNTGDLYNGAAGETLAKWNGGDWTDYELATVLTINSGSASGTGLFSTRTITPTSRSDLGGFLTLTTDGTTIDATVSITSTHIASGATRTGSISLILL